MELVYHKKNIYILFVCVCSPHLPGTCLNENRNVVDRRTHKTQPFVKKV